MISKAEADLAKKVVKARVGKPLWLRSIGLDKEDGEYVVVINVYKKTAEILAMFPPNVSTLYGLKIRVCAVRDLKSQEE